MSTERLQEKRAILVLGDHESYTDNDDTELAAIKFLMLSSLQFDGSELLNNLVLGAINHEFDFLDSQCLGVFQPLHDDLSMFLCISSMSVDITAPDQEALKLGLNEDIGTFVDDNVVCIEEAKRSECRRSHQLKIDIFANQAVEHVRKLARHLVGQSIQ